MIAKLVSQQMSEGKVSLTLQLAENGPGLLFPKGAEVFVSSAIAEYAEGSYEINLSVFPRAAAATAIPSGKIVQPAPDRADLGRGVGTGPVTQIV